MNEIWLKFKAEFIDGDPTTTPEETLLYKSVFFAGAQSTILALQQIANGNPFESVEALRNRLEEQLALSEEISHICQECIREYDKHSIAKSVKSYNASLN